MSGKLHRLFGLALCLFFAVAPAGLRAALTPEKLYKKVLPSVMTLEVENQNGERFVGSAVLALADDAALTAWHVVADAHSVWAVFADGQRVRVTGCIDRDGVHDLALLKLEKHLPHRQAVLCRELQPVAGRVYVIGAPRGFDFSISDGLISQIRCVNNVLQYQLSCPISSGNSGSPVLNHRGEVIGIATWTKTDAQNVSFAVPSQEILRLNVSGPSMTWEQLGTAGPAPTASLTKSHPTIEKAAEMKANAGNFAAFQKRLGDSAGKSVTVVLQEAGQTNIYNFTVQ